MRTRSEIQLNIDNGYGLATRPQDRVETRWAFALEDTQALLDLNAELLEALEGLLNIAGDDSWWSNLAQEELAKAREVVAKAKGETAEQLSGRRGH